LGQYTLAEATGKRNCAKKYQGLLTILQIVLYTVLQVILYLSIALYSVGYKAAAAITKFQISRSQQSCSALQHEQRSPDE
jgi:hypothetical protein